MAWVIILEHIFHAICGLPRGRIQWDAVLRRVAAWVVTVHIERSRARGRHQPAAVSVRRGRLLAHRGSPEAAISEDKKNFGRKEGGGLREEFKTSRDSRTSLSRTTNVNEPAAWPILREVLLAIFDVLRSCVIFFFKFKFSQRRSMTGLFNDTTFNPTRT